MTAMAALAFQIFDETIKEYPALRKQLKQDQHVLCPDLPDIFKAFELVSDAPNVVILGQDPYYTKGKASGLAYGQHKDYTGPVPLHLASLHEAVYKSTGQTLKDFTLQEWAKQEVLLLNIRLTTTTTGAKQHYNIGWERFTELLIEELNDICEPMIWMLWGKEAREYKRLLDNNYHLVLEADHPGRYSKFINCDHFDKANRWLAERGRQEIKWGTYEY